MLGQPLNTQKSEQPMREALRLYLDQMFQLEVAEALRGEGHDVVRASEVGQARADDGQILQKAIAENRILVTLDEHFGDWVILPLSKHPGVIRLKVNPTTSQNVIRLLVPFLRLHRGEEFRDCLLILSPKRSKWVRTAENPTNKTKG
jgi:predicted nuclease of predicted toxin-antitoxin system